MPGQHDTLDYLEDGAEPGQHDTLDYLEDGRGCGCLGNMTHWTTWRMAGGAGAWAT